MKSNKQIPLDPATRSWTPLVEGFALCSFFFPLIVYSLTLAPTVTLEDSAEYISVVRVLGLAHPPGAPAWTVVGHLATYFPMGNVALRTNFLSALFGSGSSLLLFLWIRQFGFHPVLALSASLTSAFSRCIWGQSVVTEVYLMNLFMIFLCLVLAGKWRETGDRRWLWTTAFAGGIGAGVHHLLILISPLIVVWSIWGRWKDVLNLKLMFGVLLSLGLGFSIYFYLPARSTGPIAWAPVDSFSSFISYFSRELFKNAEGGAWTQGTLIDALRFMGAYVIDLPWQLGGILSIFLIPGWWFLWRSRKILCLLLSGIVILNVPVLLILAGTSKFTPTSSYINQLYYLPATAAMASFVVFGWRFGFEFLSSRMRYRIPEQLYLPLLLAVPCFPLAVNWDACDRSDYYVADEYARNILRNLDPQDAVFPLTNNEGFLLLYFKHVAEDSRAFILDRRFGWDPSDQPYRIYTAWDIAATPHSSLTKIFGDKRSIPETLLYRMVSGSQLNGITQCRHTRPITLNIRKSPDQFPRLSPFERMIFASYSAYYARLGGAYWLAGNEAIAKEHWAKADELNPPDAFCHYLLGTLYDEAGIEGASVHFERAAEVFPISYDPLDTRFYSVTKDQIESKLNH